MAIFSTYMAFGFGPILWGRILFSYVIAVTVGYLFSRAEPAEVLLPEVNQTYCDACCAVQSAGHTAGPGPQEAAPKPRLDARMNQAMRLAGDDFFDMARYLVVGSMLAAVTQTLISQTLLLNVGQGPLISVLVMVALAFVLSICSTVDAFLARAFATSFTTGSVVSFLVCGTETVYPTMTGEVGAWDTQRNVLLMSESHEQDGKQVDHLLLIDPVGQTRQDMSGESSLVQDNAPAWSPDGKWIAFRRNELTGPRQTLTKQLWIMRADGTDARPLTADPTIDYSAPSWSTDGHYLIYHKLPLKGPTVVRSVWAMDPSTGEERQLAENGLLPLWVP